MLIPKLKDCRVKFLSCDDFRGIAISPIISKVFEHCLLNRFDKYFTSCDASRKDPAAEMLFILYAAVGKL